MTPQEAKLPASERTSDQEWKKALAEEGVSPKAAQGTAERPLQESLLQPFGGAGEKAQLSSQAPPVCVQRGTAQCLQSSASCGDRGEEQKSLGCSLPAASPHREVPRPRVAAFCTLMTAWIRGENDSPTCHLEEHCVNSELGVGPENSIA